MAIIERTDQAVAAPGTLLVPEGRILAYAHQVLARAYADGTESGEDFETLVIPEHGDGPPDIENNRSFFYLDFKSNTLYMRVSRDPVAYRAIAEGSVADTSKFLQRVYSFYHRPSLTIPATTTTPTAVLDTGDGLEIVLLDQEEIDGPIYANQDFVTQWFGGIAVEFDVAGQLEVVLKTSHEIGKDFAKTFKHSSRPIVRPVTENKELYLPLTEFSSISAVRVGTHTPAAGDGDPVEITAEDLTLPSRITYTLEFQLRAARAGARIAGNATYMEFRRPETRSYQIAHATGPILPPDPDPIPGISYFEVTAGDLSPDPGSIGGSMYTYQFAATNPPTIGSVRIVGFKGISTAPTPGSAPTLVTIDPSDYALAVGTLEIPAGVSLEASETYTLRAEVRAKGVTFGDRPTTCGDVPIKAQDEASQDTAIFFRIPQQVDNARPNSNTVVSNWTIISNRSTVRGDWQVAGIPDDDQRWLVGWAVMSSSADQPVGFSTGGFDIGQSIASPFSAQYQGNPYNVYLMRDSGAADDSYNGTTISVGI